MLGLLLIIAAAAPLGQPSAVGTPPRQVGGSISDADYPAAAIRANEQGTTTVAVTVGTQGEVESCVVVGKSGSASLDTASCALISQRFRYEPARDPRGQPVTVKVERRITWRLPEDGPSFGPAVPPIAFASGELRFTMAADSFGRRCAIDAVGETFRTVGEIICPEQLRVPVAELLGNPEAVMVVSTFTPEGAQSTARPVRGTLMASLAADFEFGPDGKIVGCTDVAVSGPQPPDASPCEGSNYPLPAIQADASTPLRRARVRHDIYRLGAPET
jgi:TonB family protein